MRRTEDQIRKMLNASADRIHERLPANGDMAFKDGFSLVRRDITWETIRRAQMQEIQESGEMFATKGTTPGKYVTLLEGFFGDLYPHGEGLAWMSTFPTERETNIPFLMNAKGHVLVAGLGMGLILGPLLALPEVKSVVVVEKQSAVIHLVRDYVYDLPMAQKLTIIQGDIFNYHKNGSWRLYDTIFLDIWPKIYLKNLMDIWKLKEQLRPRLAPGGWMGAWVEDYLRDKLTLESKKIEEAKKRYATLY